MNNREETVHLTEEQIDLIAKGAAKYVLEEEISLISKVLDTFAASPVSSYVSKIKKILD